MHDTFVTLQGNLGGPVALRAAGDAMVATFRVGCTPGRFDRATQTWISQETQWYTVTAWRRLAEHCEASLQLGDAVVVHGRMSVRTWINAANQEQQTMEVQAITVGHDLTRGTSTFERARRSEPASNESEAGAEADLAPAQGEVAA